MNDENIDDNVYINDTDNECMIANIMNNTKNEIVKFDSACSRNMSGVKERIVQSEKVEGEVLIKGFNGQSSFAESVGFNDDGKIEYYVKDMPSNLVLLCAHDYAKDGAAILYENSGVVLKLTPKENKRLQKYLKQFIETKKLIVKNRTYEVANLSEEIIKSEFNIEVAMSNSANKYFNSKINVTNNDERIMAMLLTGLSFSDIYSMVKNSNVIGLPRDITIKALNNFENRYGKTPDILQMAIPNLAGNAKGYMAAKEVLTYVGQRIEADFFQCEFNETMMNEDSSQKKTIKLATIGGAVAAYICVDAYSGYPHGWLVENMANTVTQVKRTVDLFKRDNYKVNLFAADQGILTQSQFSILLTDVQKYLNSENIHMECGEAYNHNNGLTISERNIRTVKELIRFAVMYILNNPNFGSLGFTRKQIFQLWGELYAWALWVIRLKKCGKDKSKTKYEIYHKKLPDLRSIRLLPIFSVLYALRRTKASNPLQSNREFWQRGLYVGPSDTVPCAIRVAVLTKNRQIKIVITTIYKGVSDGGNINPYDVTNKLSPAVFNSDINNGNKTIINEADTNKQDAIELLDNLDHVENIPAILSDDSRLRGENIALRDQLKMKAQVKQWGTREERVERRNQMKENNNYLTTSKDLIKHINESSNFVDWLTHTEECIYFSFSENCYYVFSNIYQSDLEIDSSKQEDIIEEGFRAVTENIPRSLSAALSHPIWGEAARKEFETITQGTGAIVKVNQEIARENIRNGADCLMMLAVYEEKLKDGETIKKVRMVANGRQHKQHGPTYSPTPSREEFLIIMHVCAALNWDYYWIDEQRAFLSAERNDTRPKYVKFQGDSQLYGIGKAIYGTKDASRDYHIKVDNIMINILKCERLHMCSCVYIKSYSDNIVIVLDHVDDFVFAGSNNEYTLKLVEEFRKHAKTDEPVLNAKLVLGMEIERNKDRRIILIKMQRKIDELAAKHLNQIGKKRNVPMPTSGYIIRDHEIENLSAYKKRLLESEEITNYMSIVGMLIWVQGIRLDIIFGVLYLSWNAKAPMQHHMDMALYLVGYLKNTNDLPLVLGGESDIYVNVYFDASHGTGPKGRSITGLLGKLNPLAGAVHAKAKTQSTIKLSSFESELDGVTTAFKTAKAIMNVLKEMRIKISKVPKAFNDNEANIEFVKGDSAVKGVRHMELRMWYTREEYKKGDVEFEYMSGNEIPADKLTKLGNVVEHRKFTTSIQGLSLLPYDYYLNDELVNEND